MCRGRLVFCLVYAPGFFAGAADGVSFSNRGENSALKQNFPSCFGREILAETFFGGSFSLCQSAEMFMRGENSASGQNFSPALGVVFSVDVGRVVLRDSPLIFPNGSAGNLGEGGKFCPRAEFIPPLNFFGRLLLGGGIR